LNVGVNAPAGDVVEHEFRVERQSYQLPVVLWRAAEPTTVPTPLILLGHGGSGHKRSERVVELARWFVGHVGDDCRGNRRSVPR